MVKPAPRSPLMPRFQQSYVAKLRDPRWQRRRLEVLEKADFQCERCGNAKQTLHVHHLAYRPGAEPWHYSDFELECLCEHCHESEHDIYVDESPSPPALPARPIDTDEPARVVLGMLMQLPDADRLSVIRALNPEWLHGGTSSQRLLSRILLSGMLPASKGLSDDERGSMEECTQLTEHLRKDNRDFRLSVARSAIRALIRAHLEPRITAIEAKLATAQGSTEELFNLLREKSALQRQLVAPVSI